MLKPIIKNVWQSVIKNITGCSGYVTWTPQPTNVVVTPITGGNRITWTSIAGTQTEIWASIDGAAYTLLTTLNIGVGTYDHTGLYAQIVDYKLRSKLVVLNVPTGLAVAVITGGLRLTWSDNNTDATHIEIYANIAGGGYSLLATVTSGTQTYDHTIATSVVYYKIRAKNTEFFSSYSSEVHEIAPAPPYDSDAIALFTRMTALGETPTDARKQIISDAFTLGKTKAFWAKMDCIWLLAAHGTLSSRLNILADVHNVTLESTPTFATDCGFTMSTGKYLHTNTNPATDGGHFTQNSASVGVVSRTNNGNTGALIGQTDAINTYIQKYTDNKIYAGVNSAANAYITVTSPGDISKKLVIITRPDASNLNCYVDGSKTNQAKASSAIRSTELLIGFGSTNEIAFAFKGGNMDDTDAADIKTVFVTGYLTSIGAI